MRPKWSEVAGLALIALMFSQTRAAQEPARHACLHYEPAGVSLKGRVVHEIFPGPPNYQSIRKGDRKEEIWVLTLEQPVCVDASEDKSDFDVARQGIRRVQLVFSDGSQFEKYKDILSGEVVAIGSLYGAHAGHHHTEVLMTVSNLAKVK